MLTDQKMWVKEQMQIHHRPRMPTDEEYHSDCVIRIVNLANITQVMLIRELGYVIESECYDGRDAPDEGIDWIDL